MLEKVMETAGYGYLTEKTKWKRLKIRIFDNISDYGALGITDHIRLEILIYIGQNGQEFILTLLHECAHMLEDILHRNDVKYEQEFRLDDEGILGGHNYYWRSIFRELIEAARYMNIIKEDKLIDYYITIREKNILPYDMAIVADCLGLPYFDIPDMYSEESIDEHMQETEEYEKYLHEYDE
jgi:hypothetical protein